MPKLINSSTDELETKFSYAIRSTVDMVLMLLGFIAGVLSAWMAEDNDLAVWWGLTAFIVVGLVWIARAFVIYRIARAREKAWVLRPEDTYSEEDRDAE